MPTFRNGSKGVSNPGSFDCESGVSDMIKSTLKTNDGRY